MSSALKTADCRKFAPNIFNKSKCQNCFRTKDAHSAEALESNRATRKVSKCGYLFVAPDWDFSQAINRTRRWQRRWFVLYDDGELTYSVDEHPDTVPQAVIDMNKVLEVANAEDVTGNQFSIAITAPEKVHFIKGTSRDESRWWFDVLSRFPNNMVRTKNKRNATLPGLNVSSTIMNCEFEDRSQDHHNRQYHNGQGHGGHRLDNNNALNCRRNQEENGNLTEVLNAKNGVERELAELESALLASEGNPSDPLKARSRRYLKRESRGPKSQRSRSDGVAKMIPQHGNDLADWAVDVLSSSQRVPSRDGDRRSGDSGSLQHNPLYLLLSDVVPAVPKRDIVAEDGHGCLPRCRSAGEKGMALPQHLLLNKSSRHTKLERSLDSPDAHDGHGTRWHGSDHLNNNGSRANIGIVASANGVKRSYAITASPTQLESLGNPPSPSRDDHMGRGVPDGCGLDPSTETKIEAPPEEVFVKKGWLTRLGANNGEWFKHWFVLRNSSLTYYSDPSAEDSGILNGVLDLQMVREVKQVDSDRGYAFSIVLWDEKKEMVLCAVTAGIRSNWIQAIRQAVENWNSSHLIKDPAVEIRPDLARIEHRENQDLEELLGDDAAVPRRNDRTQLLETSSSDDHSEYFSIVDEDDDAMDQSSRALPPSPPLNRTAISRVKEKARSRSNSRSRRSRKLKSPQRQTSDLANLSSSVGDVDEGGVSDQSSGVPAEISRELEDVEVSKPVGKLQDPLPPGGGRVDIVTKSGAVATSVAEAPRTSIPLRSSTTSQRPLPSRSSRRSASLRDLRAKKFEARCLELEEQLRLKQKELEWLQGLREVPPGEDRLLTSLNELSSLFIQSVEKLEHLKQRLDRFPEKDSSYSSSRDLCRWCTDLETVITENEQRVDCAVRSLREARTSGSTLLSGSESKLQQKVIKAVEEISALKKKLREAQDNFDDLELRCVSLRQSARNAEELHESQMALMTARVDDLTAKLTLSEKNQRQMKQKLARADSKQEKRRLSLKGKEAITLSKELEAKLTLLEQKISVVEESLHCGNDTCSDVSATEDLRSPQGKASRRLSQESLSGGDQQGILLRVHLLDQKVKSVSTALEKPGLNAEDIALLSKPKICLQTKKAEDGSQADDCTEEWSTLSLATSMTDLQAIDDAESIPATPMECVECLAQKVDTLLCWFRSALQSITGHEKSGTDEPEEDSEFRTIGWIVELADHLVSSMNESVPLPRTASEKTLVGLLQNLMLLQEMTCAVSWLGETKKDSLRLLTGNIQRMDRVIARFESSISKSVGSDIFVFDRQDPSPFAHQGALPVQDDENVTTQTLITSLETVLSTFRMLTVSYERYKKSRQAVLLKKLSDALDVHPASDVEPDAFQTATEQECVLTVLAETISKESTAMAYLLDKALSAQSSLFLPERNVSSALCRALRQEVKSLGAELSDAFVRIMDGYCTVGLPRSVLECEVVPVVADLAAVASAFGAFEGYVAHLKDRTNSVVTANSGSEESEAELSRLERKEDVQEILQQNLSKSAATAPNDHPTVLDRWLSQRSRRDGRMCDEVLVPTIGNDISSALMRVRTKLEEEREVQKRRILALQERLDAARREWDLLLREGCPTCCQLREDLHDLDLQLAEMREAARSGTFCERCEELREELLRATVDREEEAARMQESLREEREAVQMECHNQLQSKEQSHQAAIENLQCELQATRRQLKCIQSEYNSRVESLQQLYEQKLSQQQEGISEESVRLRYHQEIDQLRGLCEKGLSALEASHRRLVSHMEDRHRIELDRLKEEKEQALEQETQATLAALNAMQRAHQEELHREISSFKEEFVQKMKLSQECQAHRGKHEEELRVIKDEILSLSEKYSVKCLENASLEEKLEVTSHQLMEANYQVLDLLARNKQLSAHLTSDILQLEGGGRPRENGPEKLHRLLMLRDSELVQQREENAQMLHSLHLAQAQIRQLSSQCEKLSNSLQSERNARNGEIQRLKTRLEEIVAAAARLPDTREGNNSSKPPELPQPHSLGSAQPQLPAAWRSPFSLSCRAKELVSRTTGGAPSGPGAHV